MIGLVGFETLTEMNRHRLRAVLRKARLKLHPGVHTAFCGMRLLAVKILRNKPEWNRDPSPLIGEVRGFFNWGYMKGE